MQIPLFSSSCLLRSYDSYEHYLLLFISAGYAKNVFKKYTGQTIFDYLVETRIKEAKRLLSDPTIKVYEVSEMVGYISKAHFTETFKRKTGMTPKEYQLKGK